MRARMAFALLVVMSILTLPAFAGGKADLRKYFSDAAVRVQATANPAEKREILNESFTKMCMALDVAQSLPLLSKEDSTGLARFKATIMEKQNELAGLNGYVRVSDTQLNAFSSYVVQDMEQADEVITISLVTLLIVVLVVLLIL